MRMILLKNKKINERAFSQVKLRAQKLLCNSCKTGFNDECKKWRRRTLRRRMLMCACSYEKHRFQSCLTVEQTLPLLPLGRPVLTRLMSYELDASFKRSVYLTWDQSLHMSDKTVLCMNEEVPLWLRWLHHYFQARERKKKKTSSCSSSLTESTVTPSGYLLPLSKLCLTDTYLFFCCVWTRLFVCRSDESRPQASKSGKGRLGESDAAAVHNTGEQRRSAERIYTQLRPAPKGKQAPDADWF